MTISAPTNSVPYRHLYKVFLAGSIDMGKAGNWQQQISQAFESNNEVVLFNPRRDDWDASWKQDKEDAVFAEQVNWELNHLELADLIVMYFEPSSQSPITLLELGLFAKSGKLIVCCPDGFWRKGNVDIVCEKYGIPQVNNINAVIHLILNKSL